MPVRNLVSWSTLLGGYADKAVALLEEMASMVGMAPSSVSLVCALSACSRAGDLKWGWQIFIVHASKV